MLSVVPTYVGVILYNAVKNIIPCSGPHVCGGDPQ